MPVIWKKCSQFITRWNRQQSGKAALVVIFNVLLTYLLKWPSLTASLCFLSPSPPNLQQKHLTESHQIVRNSRFCFLKVISLIGLSRGERGGEEFCFPPFPACLEDRSPREEPTPQSQRPWLYVSRRPDHLEGRRARTRQYKNQSIYKMHNHPNSLKNLFQIWELKSSWQKFYHKIFALWSNSFICPWTHSFTVIQQHLTSGHCVLGTKNVVEYSETKKQLKLSVYC